jgi:hypothetical protein
VKPPHVTIDAGGVRVHYEKPDGELVSFPLTVDSALELIARLTETLATLKRDPEMQGRVGAAVAKTVFGWFR